MRSNKMQSVFNGLKTKLVSQSNSNKRNICLWTPTKERIQTTLMYEFTNIVNKRYSDVKNVYDWSINEPNQFWSLLWDYLKIKGTKGERIYVPHKNGQYLPQAQFFVDSQLNITENILRNKGDTEALIAIDESGNRRSLSWDELTKRVSKIAHALTSSGVVAGDRVVTWLPNSLEAVEIMLATASIGAVYSSTSPDFGSKGVLDRFSQIEPKVLFAIDGYQYNGKYFDCLQRLVEIKAGLPSLVKTIIVKNTVRPTTTTTNHSTVVPDAVDYDFFIESSLSPSSFNYPTFSFNHPWYVLYSSGTTGIPKCIVHRTGGVLIQHMKEHQLHCDIKPNDRVMYYTTTGWMMWNWLASVLASGATAVLFDGNPTYPSVSRLFDLAQQEEVSFLGLSAKYIDSLRKSGFNPMETHSLASLRTIASTGSPLSHDGFEWVYQSVKKDIHLASISGGTDLCACFVGGDPTKPVYSGEIQGPMLGMASDAVHESTYLSLKSSPHTPGELVCRQPFPSMPLGFYNDGNTGLPNPKIIGNKYKAAYFERISGMWAQGDFASWTDHSGIVIHGRSDTTLNPGGVRIGTAEITRVVEKNSSIIESLVFGQDYDNDVRIVLLVRMAPGLSLDESLVSELKLKIRQATTARHVPGIILEVKDLPRTRSNKLVEMALADAVNGRKIRNSEAIANPECIWEIAAMPELKK